MASQIRILHIEDDDRDAEIIAARLQSGLSEYTLTHVKSAESFYEAIESAPFDLILSDFSIPGFSGLDALRFVRETHPDVPFVFVSGTIGEDTAIQSLVDGATDYVLKQRPKRLVSAIRRALLDAEMKQEQRRIQDERQFQATILQNVTDAVIATDFDGRVVYWNDFAHAFLGIGPAEAMGRRLGDLDLDPSLIAFGVSSALQERDSEVTQDVFCREKGSAHWLAAKSSPIVGADGMRLGRLIILKDVSDRKRFEKELIELNAELETRVAARTEELQTANDDLKAFGYSLSHDLRAPLRTIRSFAQILLEEQGAALDNEGQTLLDRISKAGQRMDQLIESVLRFAVLGSAGVERTEVDLSKLGESISIELSEAADFRAIEWRIQPEMRANVDERLIRAVLENLFSNAVKFSIAREVAVIEFGECEEHGQRAYFVRDNGIGFDTHQAANIFNAFHRLRTEERYPGVGIGLSTVRRIVERHGGVIWAHSVPGEGASFFFTLPMESGGIADLGVEKGNRRTQ